MINPRKPDPEAFVYDSAEACWVLRVSFNTLKDLAMRRGLRYKNVGTPKKPAYRFLRSDIENYIQGEGSPEDLAFVEKIKV